MAIPGPRSIMVNWKWQAIMGSDLETGELKTGDVHALAGHVPPLKQNTPVDGRPLLSLSGRPRTLARQW